MVFLKCNLPGCGKIFQSYTQFRLHCLISTCCSQEHLLNVNSKKLPSSCSKHDVITTEEMQNVISSPKKKLLTTDLKALVSAIPQRGEVLVCGACALVGRLRLLTEDFEEEGKKMPSKYAPKAKQLCVGSSAINHLESNGTRLLPHKNSLELSRLPGVSPALVAISTEIRAISLSEAVAWWTDKERADRMYTLKEEVEVDSPPDTKKRNVDLVTTALNHLPPQALQQLRQVKDGEVDSLSAQQEAEILAVLKRQKVQLGEKSGPSCSAQPTYSGVSGAANSAFNFLMSPEFNIDGIVNKALPSSDRMEGGDSYEDNEEVQGPFFQQHQSKPPRPPISHTPSQGQLPSATIIHDWIYYFKQCKPDDKDPVRRSSHFLHQLIKLIVLNAVETEYAPEKYMLRKLLSRLSFMGKLEPPEQVTTTKYRMYANLKGDQFLDPSVPREVVYVYLLNFFHKTIATKSHSINDVDRDSARKAELSIGVTDFYQALEEVGEDLNRLLRDGFEGLGAPPFAWLRGLQVEDVYSRMQAIQTEKDKYDQPKLLMDTAAAAYSSGARQMQKCSDGFNSKLAKIEEDRTQLMEYKEKARLKVMAGLAAFYKRVDAVVRQSVTHNKGWHVGQHRDIFRGIETTGMSLYAPYQPPAVTLPCHNEIEVQDMELVQGQLQETYMRGLATVLTDHARGFPLDEKDEKDKKERADLISKPISSLTLADLPDRAGIMSLTSVGPTHYCYVIWGKADEGSGALLNTGENDLLKEWGLEEDEEAETETEAQEETEAQAQAGAQAEAQAQAEAEAVTEAETVEPMPHHIPKHLVVNGLTWPRKAETGETETAFKKRFKDSVMDQFITPEVILSMDIPGDDLGELMSPPWVYRLAHGAHPLAPFRITRVNSALDVFVEFMFVPLFDNTKQMWPTEQKEVRIPEKLHQKLGFKIFQVTCGDEGGSIWSEAEAWVQKFAASHAPMPRTGLEVGMVGQLLCPKKDILKLAGELTQDTCDDAELTSAQVIVLQRLTSINYGGLPFYRVGVEVEKDRYVQAIAQLYHENWEPLGKKFTRAEVDERMVPPSCQKTPGTKKSSDEEIPMVVVCAGHKYVGTSRQWERIKTLYESHNVPFLCAQDLDGLTPNEGENTARAAAEIPHESMSSMSQGTNSPSGDDGEDFATPGSVDGHSALPSCPGAREEDVPVTKYVVHGGNASGTLDLTLSPACFPRSNMDSEYDNLESVLHELQVTHGLQRPINFPFTTGDCFFDALSVVMNDGTSAQQLRDATVRTIVNALKNADENAWRQYGYDICNNGGPGYVLFGGHYVLAMGNPGEIWASSFMVDSCASGLGLRLRIFTAVDNASGVYRISSRYSGAIAGEVLNLLYTGDEKGHFEPLIPKDKSYVSSRGSSMLGLSLPLVQSGLPYSPPSRNAIKEALVQFGCLGLYRKLQLRGHNEMSKAILSHALWHFEVDALRNGIQLAEIVEEVAKQFVISQRN